MSGKNQAPLIANWQSTDPAIGFLPLKNNTANIGSLASGTIAGVMTGTAVLYSQIWDVSRMDNLGYEVSWTGTPTGVFQVMVSNSGRAGSFSALTFDPALAQPAGSAGIMNVSLCQLPFKYVMLKYTNASGTGVLSVYKQVKDLN